MIQKLLVGEMLAPKAEMCPSEIENEPRLPQQIGYFDMIIAIRIGQVRRLKLVESEEQKGKTPDRQIFN